jgi:hypothetical protein
MTLLIARAAHANMGLPMLALAFRPMLLLFLPILAIEASVIFRRIDISFSRSFKTVCMTNLASTFIGIPVTWVVLVLLQVITRTARGFPTDTVLTKLFAVTWQAAWLDHSGEELVWMVPSATITLFVFFFFASWLIETWISSRWLLREVDRALVKKATLWANIYSYSLMELLAISWLIIALVTKEGMQPFAPAD